MCVNSQRGGIGGIDAIGSFDHIRVPVRPAIMSPRRISLNGLSKFVSQSEGDHCGPGFPVVGDPCETPLPVLDVEISVY